jgi:hypothetical protein
VIKNCNLIIPSLYVQATGEQRISSFFLLVIFVLLDPDPVRIPSADPDKSLRIRIRNTG